MSQTFLLHPSNMLQLQLLTNSAGAEELTDEAGPTSASSLPRTFPQSCLTGSGTFSMLSGVGGGALCYCC